MHAPLATRSGDSGDRLLSNGILYAEDYLHDMISRSFVRYLSNPVRTAHGEATPRTSSLTFLTLRGTQCSSQRLKTSCT